MRKRYRLVIKAATVASLTVSVVSVVPLSTLASATIDPIRLTAPNTAQPTGTPFQVTYDGQSFSTSLAPSSMATFTISPGSSTVAVTETETNNGKLVKGTELAQQSNLTLGASSGSLPNINLDPSTSTTMQRISGFGAAMTQSSAELIDNSPSDKAIMNALFSSSGADFNIVRLPMGGSDFVTGPIYQNGKSFSYDDNKGKADPTLAKFSIGTQSTKGSAAAACVPAPSLDAYGSGDYADTIPALRCAESINPSLNILAVPWSAPGWMKIDDPTKAADCNGSDDFLNPSEYSTYSEYFLDFLKAYQLAGLPVTEVSMQNEPENCQTSYPTMEMTAPNQATFAEDLYNEIHASGTGLSQVPTIMAYDHNYLDPWSNPPDQVTGYPEAVISQSGGTVGMVGFHHYNGTLAQEQEALDNEHAAYPNVPIWMTEATGTYGGSSTQADNFVWEGQHDLMEPLQNWANASLYLNPVLNSNGGPHKGGCGSGSSNATPCRGMVTLNSNSSFNSKDLNEDYYDWAQFSKFVHPGAVHVCSDIVDLTTESVDSCSNANETSWIPTNGDNLIDTVAFENLDGSIVLVALNTTQDADKVAAVSGDSKLVSSGFGDCSVVGSGGVDCWGYNAYGADGNGTISNNDCGCETTSSAVVGVGGTGTLSNVDNLISDGVGYNGSYCALLASSGVDCWGSDASGELGNGTARAGSCWCSPYPVAVVGPGGVGTLSGVSALAPNTINGGYCAILTSGSVDCWGYNGQGQLGNGTTSSTGCDCSATPTAVIGLDGIGTLAGVTTLAPDSSYQGGFCALLSSGGVNCWGYNFNGELGNGSFTQTGCQCSATPTAVVGVGGAGTLSGVANVVSSEGNNFCALLTSGGVDCWGWGMGYALGNDRTGSKDSPVEVRGVGGNGIMHSVARLASSTNNYCALLDSGGVDCWGNNFAGELGTGNTTDGYEPEQVVGPGESGKLSGVIGIFGTTGSYCSLLSSGSMDCWGGNNDGQLGNGTISTTGCECSTSPTPVVGVGGTGFLSGVVGVGAFTTNASSYCVIPASGGVDCWGFNDYGGLGDGTTIDSDEPVVVG